MPSTDDLSIHATSSIDFYTLLSLTPTATDSEIRSAFRKTSLKYHPDKVGSTPENVDKFLLVKIAHDVLSDQKIRALYDQTREAKERRQAETEKLDAGRRKMVSELERREQNAKSTSGVGVMGVKRSRTGEEESPEQKLEREIRRISEENRQKKGALMERKERERLEEEQRLADEKEARERLRKAKECDALKDRKKVPNFSFSTKGAQPDGPTEAGVKESPRNGLNFEQTILEKLKLAQREKDRKKQLEAEKVAENSQKPD
jgi:DnaJ homolog subfamily C member 17